MKGALKISLILLLILLGGSVTAGATGKTTLGRALAIVTIKWPEQSDPAAPKIASVRLEVRTRNELLAITAVDRPVGGGATNTIINNLPAGELVFTVIACSETNGHGEIDLGARTWVKARDRSNIYISFTTAGAIDKMEVAAERTAIFVGSSLKLYAVPRSAEGDIILTKDGDFVWKTSDPAVATVDEGGLVMALTGGDVRITWTEVATGKSGGIDLSILSSGRIEGEAVWEGEVTITGDIIIGSNGKLTIRPGTKLFFQPFFDAEMGGVDQQRIELVVEKGGTLDADGRWLGSIVFTTSKKGYAGGWYGLRISSDNVTIKNCLIENATVGLTVDADNLSLEDITITSCSENGISVAPNRNVKLKKANLEYNRTGIMVSKGNLQIVESVIENNSNRALYAEEATLSMERSQVLANQDGIFSRKSELSIINSIIVNNGTHGIYAVECNLTANANRITDNGIGLRLEQTDCQKVATCLISGNSVGLQIENRERTVLGQGNQVTGNTNYEILLIGSADLVADGGFWGEPTTSQLNGKVRNLTKIFDRWDNPSLGQVIINKWENKGNAITVNQSLNTDLGADSTPHISGKSTEVQTSSSGTGENNQGENGVNEVYEDEMKAKRKYYLQNPGEQGQEGPGQNGNNQQEGEEKPAKITE